mmetsp:Transcript_5069/g.11053  ORF Transcript_5069/g.11053 Transcript_5069/m.11053 type:complete len:174 (+) Transcript_5069:364-885(+)
MVPGDSKISSILIFLASYPFTKKLNAIGISSLPAALKAYQNTKNEDLKNDVKKKAYAYFVSIFHSSAVFSGIFGRYPRLIQANAIVGIGVAVKESIAVRKEDEERARLEAERRAQSSISGPSISSRLKNWMFGSSCGKGSSRNHQNLRRRMMLQRTKALCPSQLQPRNHQRHP